MKVIAKNSNVINKAPMNFRFCWVMVLVLRPFPRPIVEGEDIELLEIFFKVAYQQLISPLNFTLKNIEHKLIKRFEGITTILPAV